MARIPTVVLFIALLPACGTEEHGTAPAGIAEDKNQSAMNEEEFWKIIESLDALSDLNGDRVHNQLLARMRAMSTPKVAAFQSWFDHVKGRAYRDDVWDAMEILLGGCGDDSFMDARAALVGLGREAFESVVQDPNQLLEYAHRAEAYKYFRFENVSYAVQRALDHVSEDEVQALRLDLPYVRFNELLDPEYDREVALKRTLAWEASGAPGRPGRLEGLDVIDPLGAEQLRKAIGGADEQ